MTGVPVALAVVSWNTRELLSSCLRSISSEVKAGLVDTWVVDNASGDESADLVREHFPWARLIALEHNVGFGSAVNLVARQTNSEWMAIANADVKLTKGSLEKLLDAGARHPAAGIIAPRLLLPDGSTQHSVYAFPTLRFTLAFNLGAGVSHRLADRMALVGGWNPERARCVDWAIGAFLLVRRNAWDAVGGFDPSQWMYAEDLDLGWRVAAAGFRTWYEPQAVVLHQGGASTSQVWGEDPTARWQRSTYAWMLRRRGLLTMRAYALLNVLGAAARLLLLSAPAVFWRGHSRARWRSMRYWSRLHLSNLLAPRSVFERHR